MKFLKFALLLPVALWLGCSSTPTNYSAEEIAAESKRMNDFFEKSFDDGLVRSPTFETYIGGRRNYGKLNDNSEEAIEKEFEIVKDELDALDDFNYDALDEQTKISYRIFKYLREKAIRNHEFRNHTYPVNQMFGAQSQIPSFMINMHKVANVDEAWAYVSRLKEFKRFFGEVVKGLERREKMGVIAPQFVYDKVIRDSGNIISGRPFEKTKRESVLLADFNKKVAALKITDEEKALMIEAAEAALIKSVGPAYEGLIAKLKDLQKKAPKQAGASSLPNGKEFYRLRLEHHTSTDMTPEEIHQIGLNEVARIQNEMREIIKKVKFKGDLKAFFKHMKTSDKFRFAQSKEGKEFYLKKTNEIIAKMKERLGELFTIKPKADLIVKPVEPYREKSAGLAFYQGPSDDGKRPGIYYVNLSNMAATNAYEMEALAYHEAIPGHHMQNAISSELKGVPKFRKYTWMTAYGEGWGLYSEMIPKEIGFYQDPYSDFGRLSMELWRAVRLVVDTGLHAKGWTREATIQYVLDNTPSVEESARKAVERYIVMPGQATAYKVGMLKILDLRQKSKAALGDKFDIRSFHDEILRFGAMPLTMLEENIDKWIARTKTGTNTL